jgi:transcriptional regulator with XRE-family HTH domain
MLVETLKRREIPHGEAAYMLGIEPGELSRYISGDRLPTLTVAVGIELAFKVPPRAWIQPNRPKQKRTVQ